MPGWLKIFISGVCVGAADIVPGISGGTVAFIIGIYEDLLKSIATLNFTNLSLLVRGRFREFQAAVSWQFLLLFLLGVACSFVTFAKVFTLLLNHETYRSYLYASFMGLVLGSIIFCTRTLQSFRFSTLLSFLFGVLIAFSLSGGSMIKKAPEPLYDVILGDVRVEVPSRLQPANYDASSKKLVGVTQEELLTMLSKKMVAPQDMVFSHDLGQNLYIYDVIKMGERSAVNLWIVACGMMAVSAMLLPGISGSYLLTVIGMYSVVLGALVDFLGEARQGSFDMASFKILASMALGIAIGAVLFSRVAIFLLAKFRDLTIASLIGFMVGAARAIWPFWTFEYRVSPLRLHDGLQLCVKEPFMPSLDSILLLYSLAFFMLGFIVVLAIEYCAGKKEAQFEGA
ncbi:MAG: hypothetical protein JWO53_259 [Chlamydiia bacterium]|nr:hypothetical protein [Chlamydiia bacterium]